MHQRRVERIGEGEAAEQRAVEAVDRRRAALDVAAAHQQHEHVVDAVAMHALGRGKARLARPRLDAELVQLDMPGADFRRETAEQRAAEAEDRRQARPVADLRRDRLEPALDAAVQRVVVEALVWRRMRLARPPPPPPPPPTSAPPPPCPAPPAP